MKVLDARRNICLDLRKLLYYTGLSLERSFAIRRIEIIDNY